MYEGKTVQLDCRVGHKINFAIHSLTETSINSASVTQVSRMLQSRQNFLLIMIEETGFRSHT